MHVFWWNLSELLQLLTQSHRPRFSGNRDEVYIRRPNKVPGAVGPMRTLTKRRGRTLRNQSTGGVHTERLFLRHVSVEIHQGKIFKDADFLLADEFLL